VATPPVPDDHPVLRAERARAAAVVARDLDRVAALLDDDLRYTHAPGTTQDRAAYLQYLASGPRFEQVLLTPQRLLDLGGGVVLTGRLQLRFQRDGEPAQEARSWVTAVWRRDGEAWRLVVFQSTREAAA